MKAIFGCFFLAMTALLLNGCGKDSAGPEKESTAREEEKLDRKTAEGFVKLVHKSLKDGDKEAFLALIYTPEEKLEKFKTAGRLPEDKAVQEKMLESAAKELTEIKKYMGGEFDKLQQQLKGSTFVEMVTIEGEPNKTRQSFFFKTKTADGKDLEVKISDSYCTDLNGWVIADIVSIK